MYLINIPRRDGNQNDNELAYANNRSCSDRRTTKIFDYIM